MLGETYSLRVVTEFLRQNNIEFDYSNARVGGTNFYDHGCRIKIDDRYSISVQTHPSIAGNSFAETALQDMISKQIVYDGTYGYDAVKQHDTPEDLFQHLRDVLNKAHKE